MNNCPAASAEGRPGFAAGDEWRGARREAPPASQLLQPKARASSPLDLTLSHIQLSAGPVGSHSKPNPFRVLLSVFAAGRRRQPGSGLPSQPPRWHLQSILHSAAGSFKDINQIASLPYSKLCRGFLSHLAENSTFWPYLARPSVI